MGNKTLVEELSEDWDNGCGDWFTHIWFEGLRSKWFLGRLRTLKEIEISYPRLREKIAYSWMLRREAIRHIKSQQIQNYKKITQYLTTNALRKESN